MSDLKQHIDREDSAPANVREAAAVYIERGWTPLPIQPREKKPTIADWPNYTADPNDFCDSANLGVILGGRSAGLVDVDLDTPEACQAARFLLPETQAIFGRPGKPGSHWLYSSPEAETAKFQRKGNLGHSMLVELRAAGCQTVVPPSIHLTGEQIAWEVCGEPAAVDAGQLKAAVSKVAAAALIAEYWPEEGSRQDAAMALAGGLLRAGWIEAETSQFIEAVAVAASDEESAMRVNVVSYTAERVSSGAEATGWPRLKELVRVDVIDQVLKWLDVRAIPNSLQVAPGENWEQPIPLSHFARPAFPVNILPDALRDYVGQLACATQTPPDLAGMLVLGVCAMAVAGKFKVVARPGWEEPLNLYIIASLPPGERKSAVFSAVTRPVERFEQEESLRLSADIAEGESRRKILEERLRLAQGRAAKAGPDTAADCEREAGRLARELHDFEVSVLPRLLADDISPEKTANLLAELGGRLAIMSAEGGIFEIMAGRYSQNQSANFDVFLKGHAGDTLRVDRIGRPPEFVRDPALTMALAVQPDVIRGLTSKPGFRGKGLLARFLYALPPSMVGRRQTDPPPLTSEFRERYEELVQRLLRLEHIIVEGDATYILRLSSAATIVSNEFAAWLEPQMAPHGGLDAMADWAAKLHGAVVRIAGILHVATAVDSEHYVDSVGQTISGDTFIKAVQLGKYLIEHAKLGFAQMGSDGELENAKHVLRWIEKTAAVTLTRREAHQALQGRFKKVDDLDPALKILQEHDFIRQIPDDGPKGPGRPASPVFEVNPRTIKTTQSTELLG